MTAPPECRHQRSFRTNVRSDLVTALMESLHQMPHEMSMQLRALQGMSKN
jgi:hypothetical protein